MRKIPVCGGVSPHRGHACPVADTTTSSVTSVKSVWSEVLNQYQRRKRPRSNLVATVKGYAAQEERFYQSPMRASEHLGYAGVHTISGVRPYGAAAVISAIAVAGGR
jgi:hypothetical protein